MSGGRAARWPCAKSSSTTTCSPFCEQAFDGYAADVPRAACDKDRHEISPGLLRETVSWNGNGASSLPQHTERPARFSHSWFFPARPEYLSCPAHGSPFSAWTLSILIRAPQTLHTESDGQMGLFGEKIANHIAIREGIRNALRHRGKSDRSGRETMGGRATLRGSGKSCNLSSSIFTALRAKWI